MKTPHHLVSILLLLLVAGCSRDRQAVHFASGAKGTSLHSIGAGMAELWRADLAMPVDLLSGPEYTGYTNIHRVAQREVDFALAINDLANDSSSLNNSHIRTVLPLFPEILFIIYKDSLHPTSIGDLVRGRKVALGPRIGGTARFIQVFFRELGIDSTEFTPVYTSYEDRHLSDSIDVCLALTGFTNPSIGDMLTHGHGRLLSLDSYELANRGSSVDGFCMKYQGARPYIIPKSTFGGMPEQPVLTIAIDAMLITRDDVDPYLVHDMVKSLVEHQQILSKSDPLLKGLSDQFDPSVFNFPLHDGVRMYLERNEPSFFKKYADVLGLALSVLVALVGGGSAFLKWNGQRKKDRIDAYYAAVLAIEKRVPALTTDGDCLTAVEAIERLRREAFDQLIGEKLAADESFRIFITLVSDTLERIGERRSELGTLQV